MIGVNIPYVKEKELLVFHFIISKSSRVILCMQVP